MADGTLLTKWLEPVVVGDLLRMGAVDAAARLPAPAAAWLERRRLSSMLRHALSRSPYYRELFSQAGLRGRCFEPAALAAVPITTKAALLANVHRVGTDEAIRGDRLHALLDQPQPGREAPRPRFEVVHTSGSTSQELLMVYDRAGWDTARAIAMTRVFKPPAFFRRPTRVAYFGGIRGRLGGVRFASCAPPKLVEFLPLDVHAPLATAVEAVQRFRPDVLGGYPSAVAQLAEAQRAGRLDLHPVRVVTSAEPLTEVARDAIRDAFAVEPVDYYASTESLVLGASCEEHRGIHLFSDWHIFEVLDEAGNPVVPGRPGTLVFTSLYNRAMPLIRYQLGDEVILSDRPCPCGSPFPLVKRVVGRLEDLLWLETNDGGRDFLHPVMMVDVGGAGIGRTKVVQRSARALEVQLETFEDAVAAVRTVRQQIEPLLRSKAMDRSVTLDVRAVAEIPPDPRTGKYRFIEALPAVDTGAAGFR